MKKLVIPVLLGTLLLAGCGSNNNNTRSADSSRNQPSEFKVVSKDSHSIKLFGDVTTEVIQDKKTKVQYIRTFTNDGVSVVPRLTK